MLTDIYIFLGALLIVVNAPLVLGLVPPNRWCGIRLTGFGAAIAAPPASSPSSTRSGGVAADDPGGSTPLVADRRDW
jgi:hypothetical protein